MFPVPRDHDLGVSAANRLRGEMRRLEPAAAHLVDRHARRAVGDARAYQCLPSRVLADAGGEHLAHDDFGYLRRFHAGSLEQCLDDLRAQFRRRYLGEGTSNLPTAVRSAAVMTTVVHGRSPES